MGEIRCQKKMSEDGVVKTNPVSQDKIVDLFDWCSSWCSSGSINAKKLADQITLMHYERLQKVKAREFIKFDLKKSHCRSPNLKVLVDWYNDFASWITVGILKAETAKQRWKRVKRCLDMATQFEKNNDLNSLSIVRNAVAQTSFLKFKILNLKDKVPAHPYNIKYRDGVKLSAGNDHTKYVTFWEACENGPRFRKTLEKKYNYIVKN